MPDVVGPPEQPQRTAPASAPVVAGHRGETAPVLTAVAAGAPGVSRGFLVGYGLAMTGLWVAFVPPLVVTLALKVNDLVGSARAGEALSLVVGVGAFVAIFANPLAGRLSDRTTSRFGMRRPWILFGVVAGAASTLGMALAPNVALLTIAGVLAQCAYNAAFAAFIGVLADQIPQRERGIASGIVGATVPVALPVGTFLVQLAAPNLTAMFMLPVLVSAAVILPFILTLKDRHLPPAEKAPFSWREFLGSFYLDPRRAPSFALAWAGRFLFVLAYAFLTTYQAFYLMHELREPADDVPRLIFVSTLVLSSLTLVSSVVGGRASDVTGRRKVYVIVAAVVYGAGLLAITAADAVDPFLVGIAIAGLGFGVYTAVDLALFMDVLPDPRTAAKDLGVANIAAALPVSLAPAVAPLILAVGGGSYTVLYTVAAACAVLSAAFIVPIKAVR